MGPLSHVYVSTEVTKKRTPLLIFGSILPDIAWGSVIQFGKQKIHDAPQEFYDFVQNNYPEMGDLGLGVRLHTSIGRGADYYSDDKTEGFAYQEAPQLSVETADLLELYTKGINIPWKYGIKINSNSFLGKWKNTNQTIALVLAHNFVESGVDLNILENDPALLKLYHQSLIDIDKQKITNLLAGYLQIKTTIVSKELERYISIMRYSSTNVESIAQEMAVPLFKTMFEREIESNKIAVMLTKAKRITKNKYKIWLDNATRQMRLDFQELI